MQRSHPCAGLAAGTLACVMALAAGPAQAQQQQYAPSLPLTPYRFFSAEEGYCATHTGVYTNHWNLYALPCNNTRKEQIFYILKLERDEDFVWEKEVPPTEYRQVRIVAASSYDNASFANRSYFEEMGFNVRVQITQPVPLTSYFLWYVNAVPKTATTWTTVATEGQTFGIAGRRTFRYGAGGVYTYKTVEGAVDGAAGQCTNAFFGPTPGTGKTCAVQGVVDRWTPYQVHFQSAQSLECIAHAITDNVYEVLHSAICDSHSDRKATIWSVMPTNYPQ